MEPTTYANYYLLNEVTGKRSRSRWKMTEAEALARDPGATVCPDTEEVRDLPETDEELARNSTCHRSMRGPGKL